MTCCAVFITQLSLVVCVVEVEYDHKIVSDRRADGFGSSLSTYHGQIVVGAPYDNLGRGSVVVETRINPPRGRNFGEIVDVNEHFIVVSGRAPYSVYVYEAKSPHNLKARIPLYADVMDVVISDESTIVVCDALYQLTIFVYDGQDSWHVAEKLKLEEAGQSLALNGSTLVVGVPHVSQHQGHVYVYNNIRGKWTKFQTIQQVEFGVFGTSVSLYGDHMAISSLDGQSEVNVVHTYHLDPISNSWINNGRFTLPALDYFSSVSMHKDFMVATLTDVSQPRVCGYVFKLSATTTSNSNSGNVTSYQWNHVAKLMTKGDPLSGSEDQSAVRVDGHLVFTGRSDGDGVGKVFVHKLPHVV